MACIANAQINTHAVTYLFASQRYNTHWVPFRFVRHYFISVLLSPPAANNFCSPAAPLRLRSLKCCANTQLYTHGSFRPSFRHAALSSLASFRRLRSLREIYFGGYTWSWLRCSFVAALLPAPSWGLAGTSGRSSLQCHTAARLQRFSADKCAARLSFFLPQALLPAY
jgi:hypothetical protein